MAHSLMTIFAPTPKHEDLRQSLQQRSLELRKRLTEQAVLHKVPTN